MNPLLLKHLQELAAVGGALPPSWEQGVSVSPDPQPKPFDIREYFQAMRPELFSQGAVDEAISSDAETNARNAGLRRMESGAAGFGLRNPDYSGMEPTRAGVQALQARQQQALQSADVGSRVGQFMQGQDAGDPASPSSMRAYAAAMTDPTLAERVSRLGRLGQVSAAQIEQVKAMGKEGAGIAKDVGAGRASVANADRIEQLLPGDLAAQPVDLRAKTATAAETEEKAKGYAGQRAKTEAETDKIRAETEAAKLAAQGVTADKAGKTEQDLRKEFQGTPMFTQANEVNNAYRKVLAAPPDPKGDIALVYSYVKILDPGSVVREGEIQLSKEGRSYETQVKAWLTKAQTGEGFTKEERAQFRSSAKALYDAQMQSYTSAAENYRRMASERGVNPGNVVLDMNIGAGSATGAGSPGAGLLSLQPK